MKLEEMMPVYSHGSNGYIWSVYEAMRIGREFHLIGVPVGGISEFPSQNILFGMPIQLSQEEVMLAIRKGWMRTLRHEIDSPQECENFSTLKSTWSPNSIPHLLGRNETLYYDVCGYRNLKIVDKRNESSTSNKKMVILLTNSIAPCKINIHNKLKRRLDNRFSYIQLSPVDLTYSSKDMTWPLSLSKFQRARYAVVYDLHSVGYWTTEGTKFGGEFVAYPGDPNLFHAKFVIRVLCKNQCLLPCIYAAHVRCSHTTRKQLVLASVHEKYISRQEKDKKKSCRAYHLKIIGIRKNLSRFNIELGYQDQALRLIQLGNYVLYIEYITASTPRNF